MFISFYSVVAKHCGGLWMEHRNVGVVIHFISFSLLLNSRYLSPIDMTNCSKHLCVTHVYIKQQGCVLLEE